MNYSIIGITMSIVFNLVLLQPFFRRVDQLSQDLCDVLDFEYLETESEHIVEAFTVVDEASNTAPGEALRSLLELNMKQSDAMERFSTEVSEALGDIVKSSMQPIFEQLMVAIDQLVKKTTEVNGSAAENILESVRTLMKELISKVGEEQQAALRKLIETLTEAASTMKGVPTILEQILKGAGDGIGDTVDAFGDVQVEVQTMLSRFERSLELAAETQERVVQETKNMLELVKVGFDNIKDSVMKASASMSKFDPTLEKIERAASHIQELARQLDSAQGSQVEAATALRDAIQKERDLIRDELASIQEIGSSLESQKSTLSDAVAGFSELDSKLGNVFRVLNDQVKNYAEVVNTGLTTNLTQFSNSAAEFGKRMNTAVSGLGEVVDELGVIVKDSRKDPE